MTGPVGAGDPDRFGPGIPIGAVSDLSDDPAPEAAPTGPVATPEVAVATAANRTHTVAVTSTDQGLPIRVRVNARELRSGGRHVAAEILQMCHAATAEAKARRREDLAAAGVRSDVLDALGLPTRDDLARSQTAHEATRPDPGSWMRPV